MSPEDVVGVALVLLGMPFFIAGTIGLLRFPDVYTRLHALTKADNVGLGFVVAGLALQVDEWTVVVKLVLVWLLVLVASATACYLVANTAAQHGVQPWERGWERAWERAWERE